MRNSLDEAAVPTLPPALQKRSSAVSKGNTEKAATEDSDTNKSSVSAKSRASKNTKFSKTADTTKTQFNKRIPKETADIFAILAVKTGNKIPELLSEAAEMLQDRYGKV
ncbi:hypothetical protein [Maritalea sp.]|uniref:hypothetical protein n=1 Tax=Maritalea sp. TaxID=2003361 RepID=UPI003EF27862